VTLREVKKKGSKRQGRGFAGAAKDITKVGRIGRIFAAPKMLQCPKLCTAQNPVYPCK
jgi:hypothetical protein